MIKNQLLIDGKWVDSSDGSVFEIVNPATEEAFATSPKATKDDINKAVEAADKAFKIWSKLSPFSRGNILRKASELVMENSLEIARLMSMEQGKPVKEAEGEVKKGAEILRYYAEEGERVYGRIIANAETDTESRVIYQPMGVAGAISPWNYPIELLAWKIGGALAAGCTVVAKLPTETPLSPTKFIEYVIKAGVPSGVINSVTGSGSVIGPFMFENEKIKKIAFTGSTAVGREVAKGCAESFKKISVELGGSLPMIVCDDCVLEEAVKGAVRRSFRNMGQICIAVNRIYVQKGIYEKFVEKFAEETKKLTIGNGLEEDVNLGAMCTKGGIDTAKSHIEDAVSKGAKVVCGGKKPEGFEKGYFFKPTILKDVDHNMLVMKEETFGPVVGVMPFETIEEVIELANDSVYGLASIVFTQNLSAAKKLSDEIDAGNVAINNVDAGVINAPYGGWKESGYGHEHGPEGLFEYLRIKHVRIRHI